MESRRRRYAAAPALAGLAAGLVILIATDDARTIGESLFAAGLATFALLLVKKWLTDTSYERERLRHAILNADESTQQAQVGRALQLAERERDRRLAEEARQDADRRIAEAELRVDQIEINTAMRAHAFEQGCEERYAKKLADGIAAAEQRASDEIAAVRREATNERSGLMISQFVDGVLAERNGEVDDLLAALEDPKLIHLDDHRPAATRAGSAEAGRG